MSADFLDSNVLLNLVDESDPGKRTTAERLVAQGLRTGEAQISFQVVQETLNVITRKVRVPTSPDDARRFLSEVLIPLWRIMPTHALYERALDIQARYRYSFYDALIIAAALAAGCTRLYSEDLQHGQRIEGLIIEDPFAE
ncbi:MAG TPA: PIN domain-containing protein [Chloroflexota bacterium]|nr:PIN domain-containing protein [Chloroflexota bacterium]